MNRDELIRRLTATFIEELAEHVRVFNAELLLLEQNPAPARRIEAIHSLFRAAHSLKGAARAVSATSIEGVAHKLEDLLSRIRDGRRELSLELFQLLFAAADAFANAGQRFATGAADDPSLGALHGRLDAALRMPDSTRAADPALVLPDVVPAVPEIRAAEDPAPSPPHRTTAEASSDAAGGSVPNLPQANSVRIGRARLDLLSRQGSELTITRRRFEARREELGGTGELVARLRAEWQAGGLALRRFKTKRLEAQTAEQFELPERVERLLQHTDEELARLSREIERISFALAEDEKALDRVATPLEAQIHQFRLLPFAQACEGLTRVLRDLSVAQKKQVDLRLVGADIEIDRAIVEGLREPLLHLLRNAVDHGIESSEERHRLGKSARASVTIAARVVGDSVEVSVTDDGRGLDRAAIQRGLRERGAISEDAGLELERAIFLPGFSTAQVVSDVSGRGVGLDIVKSAAERMNGSVGVNADALGTRFILTLPLTLSTVRVLFVRVAGEVVALPSTAVEVLLRALEGDLNFVGKGR